MPCPSRNSTAARHSGQPELTYRTGSAAGTEGGSEIEADAQHPVPAAVVEAVGGVVGVLEDPAVFHGQLDEGLRAHVELGAGFEARGPGVVHGVAVGPPEVDAE